MLLIYIFYLGDFVLKNVGVYNCRYIALTEYIQMGAKGFKFYS